MLLRSRYFVQVHDFDTGKKETSLSLHKQLIANMLMLENYIVTGEISIYACLYRLWGEEDYLNFGTSRYTYEPK